MKLRIVPARTGLAWVRLGVATFWRQPLALSGLFFMFMAVMALAGMVPVFGIALALALLPACTLGLMAASREAEEGRFPMPAVFLSAFRAGRERLRAMLILGALYGVGFLLSVGASALIDGGAFASRYLHGQLPTQEMMRQPSTQVTMLAFMALQLPLSLMFWHSPALVHWHGVPAVKSIFFSLVACLRNFWAFTVFGLAWGVLLVGAVLALSLIATVLGSPTLAAAGMLPLSLMVAAMFFTSTYFSFRDCFVPDPEGDAA